AVLVDGGDRNRSGSGVRMRGMKRWYLELAMFAGSAVACSLGCGSAAPPAAVSAPAPVVKAEAPKAAAPPALAPPEPTLRLPRNFLPTAYTARLAIDPAASDFTGAIQITGNIAERSAVLWLNARKLTVHKAVA